MAAYRIATLQVQTDLLNFKASHTGHPPYLADILQYHKPTHSSPIVTFSQFHGATFHLVLVLFVSQHQKYGIPYLLTFCICNLKRHLKTHRFQPAYPASSMRPDSLVRLWLYINHYVGLLTNLLTWRRTALQRSTQCQ